MRKLTLHVTHRRDGRVAKKVDGQYLVWPTEKEARDDLLEMIRRRESGDGSKPVHLNIPDPQLREIANLYRASRKPRVKPSTWADYEEAIDSFLKVIGKHRLASELTPDDFRRVRERWAKTMGPWRIDNRVQAVRTMFKWAAQVARLIKTEPWYGDAFRKTTIADKRKVRRERTAAHGERVFGLDELALLLRTAKGPLYTFTLLGLNGGMDAAGIAQLYKADLKRDGRYWLIDNDREKTGVRRKFILWPETVRAIEATRDRGDGPLLFLTAHGNAWVRGEINSIVMLYTDLLTELGIKRGGVNFGALKHTHVTAVSESGDVNAARLVRGHKFAGIEFHYDFPTLARIKAITDLAKKRLFTSALRRRPKRPASHAPVEARPSRSRRAAPARDRRPA